MLAAANSVFGRWDETKGEENIDFMPTILSRFDMIFIVKDEHNEERDMVGQGTWVQLGLLVPHFLRGGVGVFSSCLTALWSPRRWPST